MENSEKQYFYGYIITNSITGREYVGITRRSVKARWKQHISGAKIKKYYLYNSMRKYGINNFSIKEIVRSNNHEIIERWEIATIKHRNTFAPGGYNLTLGGDGQLGRKISKQPKIIKSIRQSLKQYHENNPDAGKKQGEKTKRFYVDHPEAREKISIKNKQNWENPKFRKKMIERAKIRCSGVEIREKLSKQSREYYSNPEARKQMSKIKKDYYANNPEVLTQMSERAKKQQSNPEFIKKMKENPANAIPVKSSDMFFRSTREAASFLKVNEKTITYRIKHKKNGYEKLTKGQEYNWEIKCY